MNNFRNATIVVLGMALAYSFQLAAQSAPQYPSPSQTRAAVAGYVATLISVVGEENTWNAATYRGVPSTDVSAP